MYFKFEFEFVLDFQLTRKRYNASQMVLILCIKTCSQLSCLKVLSFLAENIESLRGDEIILLHQNFVM